MADTIDRLTLFPPTGDRVTFLLKSYRVEDGVLHFTNPDGHTFQTTLPFALETGLPVHEVPSYFFSPKP